MDDLVLQAMAKWPNVPDCYGWLGLDARGDWYMRDEGTQAAGTFAKNKGSRLQHEKLIAFIQRNYASDSAGQWFFQNGPQRVYVELEVAPWVWRIQPDGSIQGHSGETARLQRTWVDELGRLFLETEKGFGLVHTQDVQLAIEPIEQGLWVPKEILASELEARFSYVLSPQRAQTLQK